MNRVRTRTCCVTLLTLLFVTSWVSGWAQESTYENVPNEISEAVALGQFSKLYNLDASVNPFYLRGDFDGDGKVDYALRIKSKNKHLTGIAIWLSSLHHFVILGAGTPFKFSDSVATNLDFLDTWQVYGKRAVEQGVESGLPPHLLGEAILAGKRESSSGLIYWTGKSFSWYQQGD